MKTVVVANPKGGSGKTTLAVNLGAALSQIKKVCLSEQDPQGTMTKWHKRRLQALPDTKLHRAELPMHRESLKRLAPAYDLLIVDTKANLSQDTLALTHLADLVLVPVRPSLADIEGALPLVGVFKQFKIPFHFVINAAVSRAACTAEAVAVLSQHGPVVSKFLNQSTAFMDFWPTGKVPLEMRRTSTSGTHTHNLTCEVLELLQ